MARRTKDESAYRINKDEEIQTLIDEVWLLGGPESRIGRGRKEWLHRHFVNTSLPINSVELDVVMSLHLRYVRGVKKEIPRELRHWGNTWRNRSKSA